MATTQQHHSPDPAQRVSIGRKILRAGDDERWARDGANVSNEDFCALMALSFPSRRIVDSGSDVLLSHFSACSSNAVHGWWLDLSGEDLSKRDFRGWTFVRAKFDGAAMAMADFSMASFWCCSFFKANLVESNFQNAHLGNKTKLGRQLPIGNLMFNAKLVNCNFQSADLTGAYLAGSDLSGAVLKGSNLSGVRFGIPPEEIYDLERLINNMLRHPGNIFESADYESCLMGNQKLLDNESAKVCLAQKKVKSRALLDEIVAPYSYEDKLTDTNLIGVKFSTQAEQGIRKV